MMNQEDLEKRISEIEEDFKKVEFNGWKGAFIDGIINPTNYLVAHSKIMWILKEVNSDEEDRTLLINFLRNPKDEVSGIKKGWAGTFNRIAYTTYGILNDKLWHQIPNIHESYQVIQSINDIAYTNVKKVPGGSRSQYEELVEFHNKYGWILEKQIKLYEPEIIICGGTGDILDKMFTEILPDTWKPIGNNEKNPKFYDYGNKLLIYTYHPRNSVMTNENYCNSIIEKVLWWKNKKS